MKKLGVIAAVLLAAALVVHKKNDGLAEAQVNSMGGDDIETTAEPAAANVVQVTSAAAQPLAKSRERAAKATTGSADVLSAREEADWRSFLPNRSVIRAEVARNPHVTAPSLIRLGNSFADLLDEAKSSPVAAAKAFKKFEICARDNEDIYVTSLKATCFQNAKQIAGMYPDALESELRTLSDSLDPATRNIVQAFEAL